MFNQTEQAMKTKSLFVAILITATMLTYGQRPTMELTFTAIDSADWVQLDSIKIMNQTQGGDTALYWPDTVLVLDYQVGIPQLQKSDGGFQVYPNYPNPVTEQTTISLYIPEKDQVNLIITDILGRVILKSDRVLDKGNHTFRFVPGNGNLYFFTAQWQRHCSSIKILNIPSDGKASSLEYLGGSITTPQLKADKIVKGGFSFALGDELLYIGYVDTLQSGMLDAPEENTTYTFQFATNISCPGTPTVEYEGQVYNTIQIFSQCWLKENLNVGTMIEGTMDQLDNGSMEKYCYNDESDSCTKYGGLYQWDEMMQYTTQQGTQGICPPGWHQPADKEWKVLEGAVDSQYGIGDNIWDNLGDRGYDAGTNLKTTSGWNDNGNGTNLFGFSGLPGGYRYYDGVFGTAGYFGLWWSSTEGDYYYAWSRSLFYYYPGVGRDYGTKEDGFSVRCLKDE